MINRRFDPRMPHRYVRYARMSSDRQNPRSPEQQFETIDQVLRRQGYPWTPVDDYRDDGVSGRYVLKRPGFQQMLRDIRTGAICVDLILVDTAERAGRVDDLTAIRQELYNHHGVLMLTADSQFADPTTAQGRALAVIETYRAVEDTRIKAHNVLRGKKDAARLGHWPGGGVPLGLKLRSVLVERNGRQEVDHCLLEPDPETAWIIVRLFELALRTGWGTTRLARALNEDPEIPDTCKPIFPSTVGYWLRNPIYHGELRWGLHCTGIVEDARVVERNPEEEILRVPNFCKPIVSREVWEAVADLRRRRSEVHAAACRRAKEDGGPEKQIRPLVPGLTLKYLLTGLVRCGLCDRSMRPTPSGTTSKAGKRYLYYACPGAIAGVCENHIYVPEGWLRESVIARVRGRLFPAPCSAQPGAADSPAPRDTPRPAFRSKRKPSATAENVPALPDWLKPFCEAVELALKRQSQSQPEKRPALEREAGELRQAIDGWSLSLAKPDLCPAVREDLESRYARAKARLAELEAALARLEGEERSRHALVDPTAVVDRLRRLAEVMASGNATLGNLELSRHIDRIAAYPDGSVEMRTSRLGIFDGAAAILARPPGSAPAEPTADPERVKPRRRARRRVDGASPETPRTPGPPQGVDPDQFAGLGPEWFWVDRLEIPKSSFWSADHAAEVMEKRATGMTIEALAEFFGKTPPTIRKALRLGTEAQPREDLPRRIPRRRWTEDHAAEVLALKEEGLSTDDIALRLGKSDTTIRAALAFARGNATCSPDPTVGGPGCPVERP